VAGPGSRRADASEPVRRLSQGVRQPAEMRRLGPTERLLHRWLDARRGSAAHRRRPEFRALAAGLLRRQQPARRCVWASETLRTMRLYRSESTATPRFG